MIISSIRHVRRSSLFFMTLSSTPLSLSLTHSLLLLSHIFLVVHVVAVVSWVVLRALFVRACVPLCAPSTLFQPGTWNRRGTSAACVLVIIVLGAASFLFSFSLFFPLPSSSGCRAQQAKWVVVVSHTVFVSHCTMLRSSSMYVVEHRCTYYTVVVVVVVVVGHSLGVVV